jgi:phosphoribosylanthranilate isomerase
MSVRIKFCGFTNAEDIRLAASLPIDALGIVHYAGSKRHVPLERMQEFRALIPSDKTLVALFVNPTKDEVLQVIEKLQPDLLQFHGDEKNDFCLQFGLPFMKAMAMGEGATDIYTRQTDYPDACAFLLDGHAPGGLGGAGHSFAWQGAVELNKPVYLAGGLNSENVSRAISLINPYAVDVSSGIESSPGKKDLKKMQDFIRATHTIS